MEGTVNLFRGGNGQTGRNLAMLISGKQLKDATARTWDGETGSVADVLFDDQHWRVKHLVIGTGSWLAGQSVLVPPAVIAAQTSTASHLQLNLSAEDIRSAPDTMSQPPVSRQGLDTIYRLYGAPTAWPALGHAGMPLAPPRVLAPVGVDEPVDENRGDPHLRSMNEVRGYRVRAIDGEIGHIEDFLFDERVQSIRFIVVDTRHWLPGKHVRLSPEVVEQIRYSEHDVLVSMDGVGDLRERNRSAEQRG